MLLNFMSSGIWNSVGPGRRAQWLQSAFASYALGTGRLSDAVKCAATLNIRSALRMELQSTAEEKK